VKARRYTGISDGVANGRRPGLGVFISEIQKRSEGALWNNGDYVVRPKKGKESLSVHATGRAVDLSWRHIAQGNSVRGVKEGRQAAVRWSRILIRNADLLGLELILDYFPEPFGRGWRCDRRDWVRYEVPTITGAPGGDWLHIEISPEFADDPKLVASAFANLRPLE
jgi:hypothetical protein